MSLEEEQTAVRIAELETAIRKIYDITLSASSDESYDIRNVCIIALKMRTS